MRLETLIELKFINSIVSSCCCILKLDQQFSIEQFEPTASQSTVSSPPLLVVVALCTSCRPYCLAHALSFERWFGSVVLLAVSLHLGVSLSLAQSMHCCALVPGV